MAGSGSISVQSFNVEPGQHNITVVTRDSIGSTATYNITYIGMEPQGKNFFISL